MFIAGCARAMHSHHVSLNPPATHPRLSCLVDFAKDSFVRADGCASKLANVSNRGNYADEDALVRFTREFESFEPPRQAPHPHPFFFKHYTHSQRVQNWYMRASTV